ncbi:Carboxylic ester hydrolase [Aphelenchoides fujianensis]|nr:Carboxylic ester hydrolase [Aphelenchoides fujianensis]
MAPSSSVVFALLLCFSHPSLLFVHAAPSASVEGSGSGEAEDEQPIVRTNRGPVQGFRFELPAFENHRTNITAANIYLGIPFAAPPTGELRFEKPVPPEEWTEVLETNEFPAGCPPHNPIASFAYDEDCLYLNVFTPTKKSEETNGYPVLVFIHGGGFCSGSASQFGYENVSDNFVSQGIVVITLQYRLGMMGFFSTGDKEMPGNMGLWDQREALIWVQKNVAKFGGDPNRVTLWGQSAGAASTSMHSLSRHSRGLFQQMILHSGSPYTRWSTNEDVVAMSRNLAQAANCPTEDSKELKRCMKDLDLEDVMDAAAEFPLARDDLAFLNYNPRVDGDFFEADHQELLQTAPELPTLMGFNTHEGIFLTIEIPNSVLAFRSALTISDEQIPKFSGSKLEAFIRGPGAQILGRNLTNAERKQLTDETVRFYVDQPKSGEEEALHMLKQYTLLVGDLGFIVPIMREAVDRARKGAPVYVFQFDHVSKELKKNLPFRAVSHGGEHPYLFGNHIFGYFELNRQDHKAKRVIVESFANFVKNGNPSTKRISWKPVNADSNEPIEIGIYKTVPQVVRNSQTFERVRFWTEVTKPFDVDVIRGVDKFKSREVVPPTADGNVNNDLLRARTVRAQRPASRR